MKHAAAEGSGNAAQTLQCAKPYATKELATRKTEMYEVEALEFSILSAEDILKLSEVKICNKELYYPMTQNPMPFGVLDDRLGASKGKGLCKTCGRGFQDCCGHWGHITLHNPVLHIGYFKHLINLLYCICKTCSRLLLSDEDKRLFLQRGRRCVDAIQRRALLKTLVNKCKKENFCLHAQCRAPQGVLRRVMKPSLDQFMKIVLQKKIRNDGVGSVASRTTIVNEDLDATCLRHLLKRMSAIDCAILDVDQPEKFIISSLLVPPKCIRPSVTLGDAGTNEDDLTIVFSEIVDTNNILKAQAQAGVQSPSVLGNWELLQLQCTRFINSEALAVQPLLASKNMSFNGRGICQRLKGKEGRFRGNLSGKRVDFSGRTVISPDANCPISEVVVPMWSAKRLTFPEKVCEATLERLRAAVLRGADEWPGALFVVKKNGGKTSLLFANRRHVAEQLQYGDTVERHLWDGDIVLFNRQPSLHRVSIMAHRAKVMPWRTFRFNECVCTPYNADFDGDEMNCHLPQTQEARAEAFHLMSVVNNLVTPKNGEPLVAATQDFLSGAYMLTNKDTFITRERFCQFCCFFTDGKIHIDLPPPSILKPMELWTGKQLLSAILRPNKHYQNVIVNLEVKEREFKKPPDTIPEFMCTQDGYVVFDNSELLCGAVAKMTLGNGSKKGIIYNLIRDNTPFVAAACIGRLAKLIGRWFTNHGMTIGIDDVTPTAKVSRAKAVLLEKGYKDVEKEIECYNQRKLQPHPGCTLEETLELRVKSILDELRSIAGKMTNDQLPSFNKPLIMFLSGAKGALINIAQMIALVGQQNVGGQRIQNGFVERTLPHFDPKRPNAKARGFVSHSFYDGLDPDEFFFHTMSGREGLVDTAVKTAETGYMQRRLVKALEDLSVSYDRTVRTSDGQIVQFVYGDDGLNPTVIEDKNHFISLDKVYRNIFGMVTILKSQQLEQLSASAGIHMTDRRDSIAQPLPIMVESTSRVTPGDGVSNVKEKSLPRLQVPSTLLHLCILPPHPQDTSATEIIEHCVRCHIRVAQERLEQNKAYTQCILSGIDPAHSEAPGSLVGQNSNARKRKRPSRCGVTGKETSEINSKRLATNCKTEEEEESEGRGSKSNVFLRSFGVQRPLPRLLSEKLMVMQSWRTSPHFFNTGNPSTSSIENNEYYIQAKNNVIAQIAVHEWLSPLKQQVPLLPLEIREWSDYLLSRTAELLPCPLRQHQTTCLNEKITHQQRTETVRSFTKELRTWIDNLVHDVALYRIDNHLEPGDTLESYTHALENFQRFAMDSSAKSHSPTPHLLRNSHLSAHHPTAKYYCGAYPQDPLLGRIWVVPCESSVNTNSSVKTESPKPYNDEIPVKIEVDDPVTVARRWKYNKKYWVTPRHLLEFFRLAWRKYNRALIEPGEAVGAIGAQSIGEPGTQMTLKTFHFAGVASMNVTLGVPRIKEILNASTKIATPIIQVALSNDTSLDYAIMVKSRIEKTLLQHVCSSLKQVFSPEGAYLSIKLDKETIARNFLDISTESVRRRILDASNLLGPRVHLKEESVVVISDCKLRVHPPVSPSLFFDIQVLKQRILGIRLAGLENIKRGVIKQEPKITNTPDKSDMFLYSLAVEGYGLREVMGTAGVLGVRCTSNHVMEVKQILGIEAARFVIIDEIRNCMEAYSMDIDCRHIQLLGDVMTFRGDVLGISRFGIQKIRASTLMLASFEETNEHLFEAAAHNREDKIRGVSECIIMGKSIALGTGAFDLLYNYKHQTTINPISGGFGDATSRSPLVSSTDLFTSKRPALLLSKYSNSQLTAQPVQ